MSERTYVMLCLIRLFVKYTCICATWKPSSHYNSILIYPCIMIDRTLWMIISLVVHRTSIICLYPFFIRYMRIKQCSYWLDERCSRVIVVCQFTYTNPMIIVSRTSTRTLIGVGYYAYADKNTLIVCWASTLPRPT